MLTLAKIEEVVVTAVRAVNWFVRVCLSSCQVLAQLLEEQFVCLAVCQFVQSLSL